MSRSVPPDADAEEIVEGRRRCGLRTGSVETTNKPSARRHRRLCALAARNRGRICWTRALRPDWRSFRSRPIRTSQAVTSIWRLRSLPRIPSGLSSTAAANPHDSDRTDPRHQYLLCDIEDGFSLHPLTHEVGATGPSMSPDGKYLYYFVDHTGKGTGSLTLKRVNLDGTDRQTILVVDSPLPGMHFRPSEVYPLSTISSDGKKLAISARLDLTSTTDRIRIDGVRSGEGFGPGGDPRHELAEHACSILPVDGPVPES